MKRLRELRNAKGISQQELADILHVTQQSVYKYEHGMAEPDLDIMISAANFFDTSIDYLVGNTDFPYRFETIDSSTALSSQELRIIKYYRSISQKGRDTLLDLLPDDNRIN